MKKVIENVILAILYFVSMIALYLFWINAPALGIPM